MKVEITDTDKFRVFSRSSFNYRKAPPGSKVVLTVE